MDRVAVLFNARSGALLSRDGTSPGTMLADLFRRAGITADLRPFDPGTLTTDIRELLAGEPDALIVAGGDGTVLAVAEHLMESEVPLGILPGGTMNVLARDLGVPSDLERAVEALATAPVARIDVATVNGRPFLCSSMLAMMPHLGRLREDARGRPVLGRWRMLARAARLVRRYPRVSLRIAVDGREHRMRTRTVVVSCNPLSAGPPPMPGRERLDTGRLAVYVTQEWTNGDLLGVAAGLFRGDWQRDRRIRRYEGGAVRVTSPHLGVTSVMSDGEIAQLTLPLIYGIQPRALAVLMPGAAS